MADSRAVFDQNGTGPQRHQSYKYDGTVVFDATKSGDSAQFGLAVTLTGNGQVGLCQDGDPVEGQLRKVDSDGWCSVLVEGGCLLPAGASATVTVGSKIVGALGPSSARGFVRNVATDTIAHETNGRHEIRDVSDTTNLQVYIKS